MNYFNWLAEVIFKFIYGIAIIHFFHKTMTPVIFLFENEAINPDSHTPSFPVYYSS